MRQAAKVSKAHRIKFLLAKEFGMQGSCYPTNKAIARECLRRQGIDPSTPGPNKARNILIDYWQMLHPNAKLPPKQNNTRKTRKLKSVNAWGFYGTKEWLTLRYKALVNCGAACQCCGATAKSSGAPMHVDHIKPRSRYPELELELSNLQVLCEVCNLGKSAWDITDWRGHIDEISRKDN